MQALGEKGGGFLHRAAAPDAGTGRKAEVNFQHRQKQFAADRCQKLCHGEEHTTVDQCPGGLPACRRNAAVDRHEGDKVVLAILRRVPRGTHQVDARRQAHGGEAQHGDGVNAALPVVGPGQQAQHARHQQVPCRPQAKGQWLADVGGKVIFRHLPQFGKAPACGLL